MQCPNCHHETEANESICPHCGYAFYPSGPIEQVLLSPGWDVVLGFVIGIALFGFGIGILANPFLYFAMRGKYRKFARGIGAAIIAALLLVLGIFVTCMSMGPRGW